MAYCLNYCSHLLQLNFAKYMRSGRFSYKMMPPGKVQVPGFSNEDTHKDVITKGAKGLGVDVDVDSLSLIVSNGLVLNSPLPSGVPWTLGNYTREFGGVQARSKRTFGIYVPSDDSEDDNEDEVVNMDTNLSINHKFIMLTIQIFQGKKRTGRRDVSISGATASSK